MSRMNIPTLGLLALAAACGQPSGGGVPPGPSPAPPAVPPTPGDGYRAGGNEPFWQVNFSAATIEFKDIGGETTLSAARPEPLVTANGWRFAASADGRPLLIEIERRFCQDSMSARPFPHTVRVTADSRTFEGCGGDTASLLIGPEWRVTEIEGRPASEERGPTMLFGADGSLSGNGGCNRYRASYEIAGDGGLAIGPAVATRMACAEQALNQQETRFLALLDRADRFDVAEDGSLRLYAIDAVVISARR